MLLSYHPVCENTIFFVPNKYLFTCIKVFFIFSFILLLNVNYIIPIQDIFHLNIFTCVALAKAGLVVGPLRPSVRPFVRLFVCPSVRLSATLLGCIVCVICNSNSFNSFIFKLCLMIVHTLKMGTSYFVHI